MFSQRIDRLSSSLIREILEVAQRPEVISFAGGLPATDALPTLDLGVVPAELRQYGTTEGEPRLRRLVAEQISALGRPCVAEQVLITSGSQQGIDLVSKLFIDPGAPVVLEAPSYLAALQSFRLFGADFKTLALSPSGIDPEELDASIETHRPRFAYLIPTFQNPSGYCYAPEVREAVAAVLERHGVPLVEDEPYRELVYEPVERTPIVTHLDKAPWIYLGTFSKTAIPGLRIGYVACSPDLYALLVRLKQATDLHTNRIGQWWVAEFLERPAYADHLAALRQFYRTKRDAMAASLERHFTGIADWELPPGGLFFWLRLKSPCDTRMLLVKALDRNVAFMPGEPFFAGSVEGSGMMRLNFSHASAERIDQGLATLAELIRDDLSRSTGAAASGLEM
jgi:2-aminoadipate transaminase